MHRIILQGANHGYHCCFEKRPTSPHGHKGCFVILQSAHHEHKHYCVKLQNGSYAQARHFVKVAKQLLAALAAYGVLKVGLLKRYGNTSDADGICRALQDVPTLNQEKCRV